MAIPIETITATPSLLIPRQLEILVLDPGAEHANDDDRENVAGFEHDDDWETDQYDGDVGCEGGCENNQCADDAVASGDGDIIIGTWEE
jgi:hypothetical protein